MTNPATFYPSASSSNNDSLLVALFMAAVAHVVIILGIGFTPPQAEKTSRSIDITLVNTPVKKTPEKAKFLAQENQLGAGKESRKPEPPAQKLSSRNNSQKQQLNKSAQQQSRPKAKQKIITRQKAENKLVAATAKAAVANTKEKHPHLSRETLQQQITQMGTEIRHSQQNADQAKVKFVNSVSAHKYVAAQYIKDWEGKVERTGNLNYPEVAAKKNFSATLIMDVGIKADGDIYSIRINQSSGNQALDEAAERIVRISAPFAPLPTELLKELDVLIITRVWKFSDESGMTTR
ncbi:Protein TonB [Candidatus Methylobacter favarea]|uniref:Protein TonB n=1 Tax=Candidatus Methylobacter favarea TaxID=2707345 RepID=A0A8S0X3G2_9GAMM|nr:TonB family protein [Candidatus Methylobacter favarea]CAA9892714.1 Protein TonB [Candidatus Methylobacter favarea]